MSIDQEPPRTRRIHVPPHARVTVQYPTGELREVEPNGHAATSLDTVDRFTVTSPMSLILQIDTPPVCQKSMLGNPDAFKAATKENDTRYAKALRKLYIADPSTLNFERYWLHTWGRYIGGISEFDVPHFPDSLIPLLGQEVEHERIICIPDGFDPEHFLKECGIRIPRESRMILGAFPELLTVPEPGYYFSEVRSAPDGDAEGNFWLYAVSEMDRIHAGKKNPDYYVTLFQDPEALLLARVRGTIHHESIVTNIEPERFRAKRLFAAFRKIPQETNPVQGFYSNPKRD